MNELPPEQKRPMDRSVLATMNDKCYVVLSRSDLQRMLDSIDPSDPINTGVFWASTHIDGSGDLQVHGHEFADKPAFKPAVPGYLPARHPKRKVEKPI